jgi:hypothetical protein
MSLNSKSLSSIISTYSLDLSELKFKSEGPLDERSFQKNLDELLEKYGSYYGYQAYILLRNVQIRRTKNFNGEYVLYSRLEKIISKEMIKKIFRDSPRYKEIEDSIDKYAKDGELYLPRRLKYHTKEEAEIDVLVIARGYDDKLFLYNIELKRGLKKNKNDERYKEAHLQLFRSSDVLINSLLEAKIISNDSEFYTFSILYSKNWYRIVYFFVYNRDLYAYYVNHKYKSIEYQIPLSGADMKKYAYYSKDDFEHSMEKKGIIPYLLGLENYKNYKKRR